MIFAPFSEVEVILTRAVMPVPGLSGIQQHILDALRVNAHGAHERRADGSLWRPVTFADADLDGTIGIRAAYHFAALRTAGLFEPVGIAGGRVLISHAAEVRA